MKLGKPSTGFLFAHPIISHSKIHPPMDEAPMGDLK